MSLQGKTNFLNAVAGARWVRRSAVRQLVLRNNWCHACRICNNKQYLWCQCTLNMPDISDVIMLHFIFDFIIQCLEKNTKLSYEIWKKVFFSTAVLTSCIPPNLSVVHDSWSVHGLWCTCVSGLSQFLINKNHSLSVRHVHGSFFLTICRPTRVKMT